MIRIGFGIETDMGEYPRSQRMIRIMIITVNIFYCVSTSRGVIGYIRSKR